MAMRSWSKSILRWGLPLVLCLGLFGLGGCSQNYYRQQSHAIGGGHVGKGKAGKGAKKKPTLDATRPGDIFAQGAKAAPNPFGGPALSKQRKPRKPGGTTSATRSSLPLGAPNPFASGTNNRRQRTANPFTEF